MFHSSRISHDMGDYYYDTEDDDDDDDDLVVYKEPGQHDAAGNGVLSSLAPLNQQEHLQASSSQSQSQSQSQAQAPPMASGAAKHLMTRQERKRRRCEWKERSALDQSYYNDSSSEMEEDDDSEQDEDEPLENAFASLQSLLENQNQDHQDHRHRDGNQDHDDNTDNANNHEGNTHDNSDHHPHEGRKQEQAFVNEDNRKEGGGNIHHEEDEPRTSGQQDQQDTHQTLSVAGNDNEQQTHIQQQQHQQQSDNLKSSDFENAQEEIQPSPPDFVFFNDDGDDNNNDDDDDDDGSMEEEEHRRVVITQVEPTTSMGRNLQRSVVHGRISSSSRSSMRDRTQREHRPPKKIKMGQSDTSHNHTTTTTKNKNKNKERQLRNRDHHPCNHDQNPRHDTATMTGRHNNSNKSRTLLKERSSSSQSKLHQREEESGSARSKKSKITAVMTPHQTKPTAVVPGTKSIHEARPNHWGRRDRKQSMPRKSLERPRVPPKPMQRLANASALAAATRTVPRSHHQRRTKIPITTKMDNYHGTTPDKSSSSNRPTTSPLTKPKQANAIINFAPSFLPTASFGTFSPTTDQVVEERDGQNDGFSPSSRRRSISSTPSTSHQRTKRRAPAGQWTKRLTIIRNATMSDSIRLFHQPSSTHQALTSNPQNTTTRTSSNVSAIANTTSTFVDWNHPRNKATSITSLTIVGDPVSSSTSTGTIATEDGMGNNHNNIVILCYIHDHTIQRKTEESSSTLHHLKSTIATTSNNNNNSNLTSRRPSPVPCSSSFYAWGSFQRATARSISIRKGLQLRVYNAQVIPYRHRSSPFDSQVQQGASNGLEATKNSEPIMTTTTCHHSLVCTQLCEPYSSTWPALTMPHNDITTASATTTTEPVELRTMNR